MADLEVRTVGETINKRLLQQVSESVNLPPEVCSVLLKSGWTLDVSSHGPASWTQAWPKELRS